MRRLSSRIALLLLVVLLPTLQVTLLCRDVIAQPVVSETYSRVMAEGYLELQEQSSGQLGRRFLAVWAPELDWPVLFKFEPGETQPSSGWLIAVEAGRRIFIPLNASSAHENPENYFPRGLGLRGELAEDIPFVRIGVSEDGLAIRDTSEKLQGALVAGAMNSDDPSSPMPWIGAGPDPDFREHYEALMWERAGQATYLGAFGAEVLDNTGLGGLVTQLSPEMRYLEYGEAPGMGQAASDTFGAASLLLAGPIGKGAGALASRVGGPLLRWGARALPASAKRFLMGDLLAAQFKWASPAMSGWVLQHAFPVPLSRWGHWGGPVQIYSHWRDIPRSVGGYPDVDARILNPFWRWGMPGEKSGALARVFAPADSSPRIDFIWAKERGGTLNAEALEIYLPRKPVISYWEYLTVKETIAHERFHHMVDQGLIPDVDIFGIENELRAYETGFNFLKRRVGISQAREITPAGEITFSTYLWLAKNPKAYEDFLLPSTVAKTDAIKLPDDMSGLPALAAFVAESGRDSPTTRQFTRGVAWEDCARSARSALEKCVVEGGGTVAEYAREIDSVLPGFARQVLGPNIYFRHLGSSGRAAVSELYPDWQPRP